MSSGYQTHHKSTLAEFPPIRVCICIHNLVNYYFTNYLVTQGPDECANEAHSQNELPNEQLADILSLYGDGSTFGSEDMDKDDTNARPSTKDLDWHAYQARRPRQNYSGSLNCCNFPAVAYLGGRARGTSPHLLHFI